MPSYIQLKRFLIHPLIHIKPRTWPSLRKLGSFSKEIITIPSNFGIVLVKTNGCFMILLTKEPRDSIYHLYSFENYHRTLVERRNMMKSQICGKLFKFQVIKEDIFLTTISISLNLHILKADCG